MKWQPIETAPKDGREFLAYDPIAKKFDVVAWDRNLGYVWQVQYDGEFGPLEDEFHGDRATYWTPLRAHLKMQQEVV